MAVGAGAGTGHTDEDHKGHGAGGVINYSAPLHNLILFIAVGGGASYTKRYLLVMLRQSCSDIEFFHVNSFKSDSFVWQLVRVQALDTLTKIAHTGEGEGGVMVDRLVGTLGANTPMMVRHTLTQSENLDFRLTLTQRENLELMTSDCKLQASRDLSHNSSISDVYPYGVPWSETLHVVPKSKTLYIYM